MAITNPTKYVSVQRLGRFETKLAAKYQTKSITAISGLNAQTVEGALDELLGKITGLPSAVVPKGTKAFAGLTPQTDLAAANVGFMWNISDSFTTTADFVEGAGKVIPAGANVYVANPEAGVYKYDVFQGMVDLSNYKTKQTAVADADATTSGTDITFVDSVTQNENGVITVHKKGVQLAVAPVTGDNPSDGQNGLLSAADKGKLDNLDSNLSAKADKDADAVDGNIAEFDANGNPVDSGHALSEYKTKQTAVSSPSTGSTPAKEFIASISQDENGVISATKEAVQVASPYVDAQNAGQDGLMSAADKAKLDAMLECSDADIDSIFD